MPDVVVPPHVRRSRWNGGYRPVSGYRRQRRSVLTLLAAKHGHEGPACAIQGCPAPEEELQIAHLGSDPFKGFAARSGGSNYSRWMTYVRAHPENYDALCAEHHGKLDCRVIAPPFVHHASKPKRLRNVRYAEWKDLVKA